MFAEIDYNITHIGPEHFYNMSKRIQCDNLMIVINEHSSRKEEYYLVQNWGIYNPYGLPEGEIKPIEVLSKESAPEGWFFSRRPEERRGKKEDIKKKEIVRETISLERVCESQRD